MLELVGLIERLLALLALTLSGMTGAADPALADQLVEPAPVEQTAPAARVEPLVSAQAMSLPVPAAASAPAAVSAPAPTPEPVPTAQPVPTAAPAPTAQPVPTAVPVPTAQPVPTTVPVPTAVSLPVPAAAPAQPVDARPNYQQRGEAALTRVPVQPSSLGFSISFLPAKAGYGGLTWPDRQHIEIYVDAGWSEAHLVHVIAHEIGHAVDLARNSRADHDAWKALRGMDPNGRWWADPYTSDFASPGGDFAECFAAWAVGSGSNRSHFGSCAGTGALMSQLVAG